MSVETFIFARSTAEPDSEFPSLAQLARSILAVANAGGPRRRTIVLSEAQVSRGMLPGGRAVSVHVAHIFLGYAFMAAEHTVDELRDVLRREEALAHAH